MTIITMTGPDGLDFYILSSSLQMAQANAHDPSPVPNMCVVTHRDLIPVQKHWIADAVGYIKFVVRF